ncbi:hypothetical protein DSO57_1035646 [Entomophthora muscae]|uniref:Uncharacterized protein n=2 Tax=Entomophthora muscae TaxID=34485 RepID=A0ACC2T0F3_9FUNG|nr:hypothetical protein DSO57_1035645 [Entomophthora muscae]KAJ9067787.1 hypothetical protein DSO57_1035646 [Entomophthora muscae]
MLNTSSPTILLPSSAAHLNLKVSKRPLFDISVPRLRRVTARCLLSQPPSTPFTRPSLLPEPRYLGPRSSMAPSLDTILEEE